MKQSGGFCFALKTANLKREILALPLSKKAVFAGLCGAIFFAFFPWFEITSGFGLSEATQRMNGFSRFGIFGAVVLTFAFAGIAVLGRETFLGRRNVLGLRNYLVLLILTFQSMFTVVLAIFVFASFFSDFSQAQFRFGIFLTLLSQVVAFAGAYFHFLENQKLQTKREFKNLSDEDLAKLNLQPEMPENQLSFGD